MVRKRHSVLILFIATQAACGALSTLAGISVFLICLMINDGFYYKDNDVSPAPAPSPTVENPSRGRRQLEKSDVDFGRPFIEESNEIQTDATAPERRDMKSFRAEEITRKLVVILRKDPEDIRKFMRKIYCPVKKLYG